MRILHVIPQFPYFGGRTIVGGHASCLFALARSQHESGDQVSILSYMHGRTGRHEVEGGPAAYGLFASARTRTVGFGFRFLTAAVHWIEPRRKEFDVIHMHSGYADYFLVSSRLKKKSGLPTVHTLYCPIPKSGGRWRIPFIHLMIRRWANEIDWTGGISHNVVDSMVNYGIQAAEAVYPAVDVDRFAPDGDGLATRKQLGIHADDLAVLFVGNAKPQKNAARVLEAIHKVRCRLPNVRLVLTTELKHSSSDSDLAKLARRAKELGLEESMVQLGIVSDMPSLMRACDVLVAPFLDTYGPSDYFMAALEAMACGKPVVVSKVGGMPEVVSDEVGRLVDPHSAESIADGLLTYLSDVRLRVKAGARARNTIESRFCPRTVLAAQRTIYEKAMR